MDWIVKRHITDIKQISFQLDTFIFGFLLLRSFIWSVSCFVIKLFVLIIFIYLFVVFFLVDVCLCHCLLIFLNCSDIRLHVIVRSFVHLFVWSTCLLICFVWSFICLFAWLFLHSKLNLLILLLVHLFVCCTCNDL